MIEPPVHRRNWWTPVVAALSAVASPFILLGILSVENDTTDMRQWLPDGSGGKAEYDHLVEQFGPDDFVMVSWPGCTLTDPRLGRFAESLQRRAGPMAKNDQERLFRDVKTGPSMLDRLMESPVDLSQQQAINRLLGFAVGPNGTTTCALIEFTSAGKQQPHAVVDTIVSAAKESCDLERDQLRMGGGVYEAVIIDDESAQSLLDSIGWSCLIGFAAAWIGLRSLRMTVCVIFTAVYCTGLSVALVYYGGGSLNAVMTVLPALIFVLIISGSVHLVNYYRDAVTVDTETASRRAMAAGWLPCTLAAITTAIGMMSLSISQIRPVRSFGIYSALGLLVSLPVMLVFLRIAFRWQSSRMAPGIVRRSPDQSAEPKWVNRLADIVVRHHIIAALASMAILGVVGGGLLSTTSSVKLERMFRPDNELIRNYRWLEEEIGPLAALEVVVHFRDDCPLTMLDRLRLISGLERSLKAIDATGAVVSASLFTPRLSGSASVRSTIRRAVMNRRLMEARPRLIADGLLAEDGDEELWRVTVRLPALRELDYDEITARIHDQAEIALFGGDSFSTNNENRQWIFTTYTGAFPMIHNAQQQLLDDLVSSFLLAFALICPVMMVILRGFLAGLAAMLANLAPAVAIFGGMGWFRVPIDIGTVLTASVALGVAVDDTLHLLTWFRRGLHEGMSRDEAVRMAVRRCAAAMVQTTLICGLGMLAFANSSFVPASRFAWLMFTLLIAALFGDLVLLPSLLAGPVGRLFTNAKDTNSDQR